MATKTIYMEYTETNLPVVRNYTEMRNLLQKAIYIAQSLCTKVDQCNCVIYTKCTISASEGPGNFIGIQHLSDVQAQYTKLEVI